MSADRPVRGPRHRAQQPGKRLRAGADSRQPGFGHHISRSHRRSKRRFDSNVQSKRCWLPSEGRHVRPTLSAKGIKTVDTIGIEAAVARIRARGGEGLMAKKSKIAKNDQRRLIVARYAARRAALKAIIAFPGSSDEDRTAAQRELRRHPRDASATRLRNRDSVDGRPPSACPVSAYARWPTRASSLA